MTDPIADELRDVLDGRWIDLRRRARTELPADVMLAPPGLTIEEHRTRTTESLLKIAELGYGRVGFPAEFGGRYICRPYSSTPRMLDPSHQMNVPRAIPCASFP